MRATRNREVKNSPNPTGRGAVTAAPVATQDPAPVVVAQRRTRTTPVTFTAAAPRIGKAARYVHLPRERCPSCGSTTIKHMGGTVTDPSDGTITRNRKCATCGHNYRLVLQ